MEWTGGTFSLDVGAQLNGSGVYKITGGTVSGNADLTVQNLDLAAGTLTGTGTVAVASMMNWSGGTMSGSGRTVIPAGATLSATISGFASLTTRTLENGGTIFCTGAGVFAVTGGAVITNRPGALFQIQSENSSGLGGASANGRFDNAGTFRKSAGTGTTIIANGLNFINHGTVDIRSGILAANGTYTSISNALLSCALDGTTAGTGHGQLQVAGTVTLNGALSVDLTDGFAPALNDSFTILTAGTRNGTFANFFYPSNAVTMQLSNTVNSVIVRVTGIAAIVQPMLFPPVLSSSNVVLCWTAESNKTYRLEFNLDPSLTNWDAVPGDVTTVSNTACKLDVLTPSNRFYRVRVLP